MTHSRLTFQVFFAELILLLGATIACGPETKTVDLSVECSSPGETKILNAAASAGGTAVYDKVSLRTYNGELVGETIRVKPGQRLQVNVTNKLTQASLEG